MNINIQRAVLSSFLWSNDVGIDTKDAFILNQHVFTGDRILIAAKINEVTETEYKFYSLLNMELENTSQEEWMEIAQQTPMPFSLTKRYYEKLGKDYMKRKAGL